MKINRLATFLLLALLLLGLPLLGAALAGFPLGRFLEFPPISRYHAPAPFAWPAFIGLALFEVLLYLPVLQLARSCAAPDRPPARGRFPGWGYAALAWTAGWWVIAWTRLPAATPLQAHTFTPLWLGYIAVVNAWTFARSGRCMLTHQPRHLAALFMASAGFWWFFEYLNRFVQNWYYEGITDFTPLRYLLFATPAFGTVLPAVLGTADLLDTWAPAAALRRTSFRWPAATRLRSAALLLAACVGLAGIGIWPDYLYPLLWIAPLCLLVALRGLTGRPSVFAAAERGDWRRIAILMTAALICGFFWEMWNFHSHARWVYQVPFVGRFLIFEMPLLGFAGYLPFGLECAVIADALVKPEPESRHAS